MNNNLFGPGRANYPPPHPIHYRGNLHEYLSRMTQRADPFSFPTFDDDVITIGVREPTLPPDPFPVTSASYETWMFTPGVDPEPGHARRGGFTLERDDSGYRSVFGGIGPPSRKKRFSVNVGDDGGQVFAVKEDVARSPGDWGRDVKFLEMPAGVDLREGVVGEDGFRHVTLRTENLLPRGASQIDVGYWYVEEEGTGMRWQ